jgi:hypothetical protein
MEFHNHKQQAYMPQKHKIFIASDKNTPAIASPVPNLQANH